jgi:hypothetical protein
MARNLIKNAICTILRLKILQLMPITKLLTEEQLITLSIHEGGMSH